MLKIKIELLKQTKLATLIFFFLTFKKLALLLKKNKLFI